MLKTVLSASYYADALPFMSDEQVRYYLNGLCIEPRGIVAATDGHILFVGNAAGEYASDEQGNIIVPRSADLLKHCRPKGRNARPRFIMVERANAQGAGMAYGGRERGVAMSGATPSAPRRVQVPAYTDAWMQGDRYGDIVGQFRRKEDLAAHCNVG